MVESLGLIKLEIRFEGPPPGDKMSGTLHVTIREGRNLTAPGGASTADPYVKLYLSKDGKDIKTTKQKTKHQRNTLDPLFEERLIVYLQPGTALDENTRLQITVWDNGGRLASNECMGGLSFSLEELSQATLTTGWFDLLPEIDGREHNLPFTGEVGEQFQMKRSGSTASLATKGLRRMTGSFRKSMSNLTKKKDGDSTSKTGSIADLRDVGRSRSNTTTSARASKVIDEPPRDWGRIEKKAAPAQPESDDDTPGDFGARVGAPAPAKAPSAASVSSRISKAEPAVRTSVVVSDDAEPGDWGQRVRKPAAPAGSDDERDAASVSSYVPSARSDAVGAAPITKLPAKETSSQALKKAASSVSVDSGDFDPEGELPGMATAEYHGSMGSLNSAHLAPAASAPAPAAASPAVARSLAQQSAAFVGSSTSLASTQSATRPLPQTPPVARAAAAAAAATSAAVADDDDEAALPMASRFLPQRSDSSMRSSTAAAAAPAAKTGPMASLMAASLAAQDDDDDTTTVRRGSTRSAAAAAVTKRKVPTLTSTRGSETSVADSRSSKLVQDPKLLDRVAALEHELELSRSREEDLQRENAALQERAAHDAQTIADLHAAQESDSRGKERSRDLDKLQQLSKLQEETRRLRAEAREAREQRDNALSVQKGLEDKVAELSSGLQARQQQGLEAINAQLLHQVEQVKDKNTDLVDENHDLRAYIDRLLVQLLQLDEKAIERAAVSVI